MRVSVVKGLIAQIVTLANGSPDEICGLLFGTACAVTGYLPCRNVAADPRVWFEVDPGALLAAHRASRTGGPRIVGHYHSHPSGCAFPSPRDAAAAADGSLWMIAAAGAVGLYRSVASGALHGRFDAVVFDECDPACTGPLPPPEMRGSSGE